MSYDWTPERYRRRQPSCWDPPWTRRYNHNGKTAWGTGQPDSYPAYRFGARPPRANRREGVGFHRHHVDDEDGDNRQPVDHRREESNPATLDLIMERLDRLEKIGTGRDDSDRRCEYLEHSWPRGTANPSVFDEGDDGHYDEPRRLRSGGRFGRDGYTTYGPREGQHESRPGRDNWDRNGPVWTTQGLKMDPNLDFRDGPPEERARRDEKASPYPAAVNDYNEKWRVYRLQHFPLLAELNATLKKQIDDVNLDVDVPIDEPLEEIVKTDSTPRQVLVGVYEEKIDDLSVPTHKELEMREDKETLLEKENNAEAFRSSVEPKEIDFGVLMEKPSEIERIENQEDMEERTIASFNVAQFSLTNDFVDADVPSIVHGSTSLDVDARFIPPGNDAPYLSVLGSDKGRLSTVRYVFDPGGDASPKLSTIIVASWFPP